MLLVRRSVARQVLGVLPRVLPPGCFSRAVPGRHHHRCCFSSIPVPPKPTTNTAASALPLQSPLAAAAASSTTAAAVLPFVDTHVHFDFIIEELNRRAVAAKKTSTLTSFSQLQHAKFPHSTGFEKAIHISCDPR